jgi:glutamine--tRNA ligase
MDTMNNIPIAEGSNETAESTGLNFIEQVVVADIQSGKYDGRVQTRFPPEPNGYLHIGHAKAICIDFGIAQKYGGVCNLRFDDTNPIKEDVEYVDAIREDIHWLGFEWGKECYASDYFPQLYAFAERLIMSGHAYVDEQSAEEIARQKGTPTTPGIPSPYRDRPAEESLDLFHQMNEGKIPEGAMTLRAKIDMASDDMHFRDPIIYRIIKRPHHRTGTEWQVYPMYDFAHGQSDYFEGVTHSICTLEFVQHRPLYNYFVELLKPEGTTYRPYQFEFNRLNLTYTMMSKRKLLSLVEQGLVSGWDDPRMPTLCGLRRRGYTPQSIRDFVSKIGYTRYEATIDLSLLEHAVRNDLNKHASRVSAVLDPVKLILTNLPEGHEEALEMVNNPEDLLEGTHIQHLTRELWIDRSDFMEDAPKKYYRLTPGGLDVRLRGGYIIKCTGCKKDDRGNLTAVLAEVYPDSKTGMEDCNRKVRATIHWVSTDYALDAEVRLYDRLFLEEDPSGIPAEELGEHLNPNSLVVQRAYVEECLQDAKPGDHLQFQRVGYFTVDPDSRANALIFNRTASLKDRR